MFAMNTLRRAVLAAFLAAVLVAGCETGIPGDPNAPDDGDDGGAITLRIPTRLRVFPGQGLPPAFELRWNYPADAIDPVSFVIYHSDEPITTPSDDLVVETVSGDVRSALMDIAPDTGVHYFRVAPVGLLGAIGEASTEHAIDTDTRMAYVGKLGQSDRNVVYYSNMDGAPPTIISGPMLTGGSLSGGPAMWSPTGMKLAFIGDPRAQGKDELFVVPGRPVDSFVAPIDLEVEPPIANARVVAAPPPVSGDMVAGSRVLVAAWSPDGSRLAFISDREALERYELWMTDAVAVADVQPIPLNAELEADEIVGSVKWSPDAERVAYAVVKAASRGEAVVGVYVKDVDSDEPAHRVDLTEVEGGAAIVYGWSPDGSLLGLVGDLRLKGATELFVTDGAPDREPVLVSDEFVAGAGVIFGTCAWSYDGRQIAYAARDAIAKPADLFVVDVLDDGEPFPVSGTLGATAGVTDSSVIWSPDGTQLAFLATTIQSQVTELYVTKPAEGAEPFPVSGDLSDDADVKRHATSWSPDGTRLAFIADKITDKKNELYVALAEPELEPVRVSGNVANGDEVSFARWSTDGEHIAFTIATPAGRSSVQSLHLADASGLFAPVPISTGEPVGSFGFSPIGNELAAPGCGDGATLLPAIIAPLLMVGYTGRGRRRAVGAVSRR